jgi:hypothetical protein
MALLKCILKMAQLEPFGSRRGMFAESFSMMVSVVTVGDDVAVDIGGRAADVDLGEGFVEVLERADRGTKELDGLVVAVLGRAGPITCRKCMNRKGVSERGRVQGSRSIR